MMFLNGRSEHGLRRLVACGGLHAMFALGAVELLIHMELFETIGQPSARDHVPMFCRGSLLCRKGQRSMRDSTSGIGS